MQLKNIQKIVNICNTKGVKPVVITGFDPLICINTPENPNYKFKYSKFQNELIKKIVGGRMILCLGNPSYFGDAYDIDIMLMLKSSRLINSFPSPLPTFKKIGLAIYIQELKLKGKYNALIGDATSETNLQIWSFGEKVE